MSTDEQKIRNWFPSLYKISDAEFTDKDKIFEYQDKNSYYAQNGNLIHIYINYQKKISYLPSFFKNFTSLEVIVINHCEKFQSLRNFPSSSLQLKTINLSENHLLTLEHFPTILPNLRYLMLDNNCLQSLQGLPAHLPQLELLDLAFNQLSNLFGLPSELHYLRDLVVCRNRLTSLLGLPDFLPELIKIDVMDNQLHFLPLPKSRCPKLREVWDGHNPWAYYDSVGAGIPYIQEVSTPSIPALVNDYLHSRPLSPLQLQRIIEEGTYQDWFTIYATYPQDAIILPALGQRVHVLRKLL